MEFVYFKFKAMKANPKEDRTRVQIAVWKPKIEKIQQIMSDHYKVPISDMRKHSRVMTPTKSRQMVHYFVRELMPLCPLAVIGFVTGNGISFDHSSISHSHSKIKNLFELKTRLGETVYPNLVSEITALRELIINIFNRKKQAWQYRQRCHAKAMYHKSRKFKPILNETR